MRCRLANKQTSEMQKLSVRGSICNGAAKWSTVKGNEALPVWFVFSGEPQGAACKEVNIVQMHKKCIHAVLTGLCPQEYYARLLKSHAVCLAV